MYGFTCLPLVFLDIFTHRFVLTKMTLKTPMKRKIPHNDQNEESDPAENGHDETKKNSSNSVNLSDTDKEKGNFSNFNISKSTIKKLKGLFLDF